MDPMIAQIWANACHPGDYKRSDFMTELEFELYIKVRAVYYARKEVKAYLDYINNSVDRVPVTVRKALTFERVTLARLEEDVEKLLKKYRGNC